MPTAEKNRLVLQEVLDQQIIAFLARVQYLSRYAAEARDTENRERMIRERGKAKEELLELIEQRAALE